MDAKKAALRQLMKGAAQKREKKIDSPLVRYNELGQIVCKICNVVVKSETLWTPHLASNQHKERIAVLKAKAQSNVGAAAAGAGTPAAPKPAAKPAARPASSLPPDFFEAPSDKQPRTDPAEQPTPPKASSITEATAPAVPQASAGPLPPDFFDKGPDARAPSAQAAEASAAAGEQKTEKGGGALPKGFFDDVVKDHKARGEKYQKPDLKEELKVFEKLINPDIKEIESRQAEEEAEAAEEREEVEQIEQRSLMERLAVLKQKKEQQLAEAKARAASKVNGKAKEASSDEDEDDEEDDDQFLDWRAKTF